MKNTIYLDNAATTEIDESILKNPLMKQTYANASSQHSLGKIAKEEIEKARMKIAKFINAEPEEIIFTSGGTESNNLAIKGLASANPDKNHIITSKIEHPSVIEVCKFLESQGYKIDYINVNEHGILNPEEIRNKITEKTLLVTIMHVNNEIGTIQPIEEIGKTCKEKNVYFHSDCVQSFEKEKIDVKKMNLDLISVSGHKINAPKGIGFLYIKKHTKINPIFHGGGQERNLRSGTENTQGIISLSEALNIKREIEKVRKSRDYLINELLKIKGTRLNGSKEQRIHNNINISFYGIEGESLMLMLNKQGIEVSTGSACSSNKLEESHVLKAIDTPELYLHGSIRITLDTRKPLTKTQEEFIIKQIKQNYEKLQKISPFKFKG